MAVWLSLLAVIGSVQQPLKCQPFSGKVTLITFDSSETVIMDGKTVEIVSAIDWLCTR